VTLCFVQRGWMFVYKTFEDDECGDDAMIALTIADMRRRLLMPSFKLLMSGLFASALLAVGACDRAKDYTDEEHMQRANDLPDLFDHLISGKMALRREGRADEKESIHRRADGCDLA
jgi:hypothetical protein